MTGDGNCRCDLAKGATTRSGGALTSHASETRFNGQAICESILSIDATE